MEVKSQEDEALQVVELLLSESITAQGQKVAD